MAIELTYGDDADQQDVDRALLTYLGQHKQSYVIEVTSGDFGDPRVEDVVIQTVGGSLGNPGSTLYVRSFDELTGEPTGRVFGINVDTIHAIKIY